MPWAGATTLVEQGLENFGIYDTIGKVEVDKDGSSRFYGTYNIKETLPASTTDAHLGDQSKLRETPLVDITIPRDNNNVNTTSKIKSEIQSKIPVSGDSEAQAVETSPSSTVLGTNTRNKNKQLGSVSKQHAVQKIERSDKVVKNPLESMIQNATRTVNEGERNKVAKMLLVSNLDKPNGVLKNRPLGRYRQKIFP